MPGLTLAAALAALAGCNAPGPRSPDAAPLSYAAARGYDLMDILELNVGAGPGLYAAVAVEPARIGYGYYDATKVGMMGRAAGAWDEQRRELFLGVLDTLSWSKKPCCGDGYLFDPEETHRGHWMPDYARPGRKPFYEEWGWISRVEDWERPWLDVNAEVHLLFVGVDVGVSLQDTFDFVLGIFGVDAISHDDFAAVPENAVPTG